MFGVAFEFLCITSKPRKRIPARPHTHRHDCSVITSRPSQAPTRRNRVQQQLL